MTDTLTPEQRSERMSRVRGQDTKPEMRVRKVLHAAGLPYRLQDKRLPGRPDMVFPSRQTALFVHGCFFHRHTAPSCKLARLPKSRLDFWLPKLEGNAERDRRHCAALDAAGWKVITVWECETKDAARLAEVAAEIRAVTPRHLLQRYAAARDKCHLLKPD